MLNSYDQLFAFSKSLGSSMRKQSMSFSSLNSHCQHTPSKPEEGTDYTHNELTQSVCFTAPKFLLQLAVPLPKSRKFCFFQSIMLLLKHHHSKALHTCLMAIVKLAKKKQAQATLLLAITCHN